MPLNKKALETLYNSRNVPDLRKDQATLPAVLEQYQLYVEMTDRISHRRQNANSFFLTLNSAIISLGGYTVVKEGVAVPVALIWLTVGAGILISLLWLRLILSYRDLNSAKFEIIHAIEKTLPVSPYDAEWEALGRGGKSWLYLPFTHIELWVPAGFIVIHILGATILTTTR